MDRKKDYTAMGVTAFLTAAAVMLLYDTLFGGKIAFSLLRTVRPILYGAFVAYLLAPIVNFFERHMVPPRLSGNQKLIKAVVRTASMLLSWILVCCCLYVLAAILVPELYRSVQQLIANVDNYYNTISGWVSDLLDRYPDILARVQEQMDTYFGDIESLLTDKILPRLDMDEIFSRLQSVMTTVSAVSSRVLALLNLVKDLLVGFIASIYLLAAKERCAAYGRRLVYSLFSRENAGLVLRGVRRADSIFSGFVRGKLLDSIIIGILCFAGSSILKFPYASLVSVFVGVTNIIPFFGPFLGAIPSTFLILLVSPIKALYFLIFVLALQQLDGNVIGPKILGNSTGLSSIWVIIAILVGGGFFGIAGMFFGVPVCGCLLSLVNFFVDVRLRKKGLPLESGDYEAGGAYGPKPVEKAPSVKSKN